MAVETHGEEHGEQCAGGGGTVLEENARRDCGAVASVELEGDEDDNDEAEPENAAPDFRVVPRVDGAAPLEGEEQTRDGTDQEEGAEEVDLPDFLACGELAVFALGIREEKEDRGNGAAAER